MSKKSIIIEPDPLLRKKSDNVEKIDNDLRKLLDDMLETMYEAPGIGLAGVQVGVLKRLIVIDIAKEDQKKNPLFLINPKITFKSENTSVYEEGFEGKTIWITTSGYGNDPSNKMACRTTIYFPEER